jgi:hypothetical protein
VTGPVRCCGRPYEDDLNACPRSPSSIVIGTQVRQDTEQPVVLVLTTCDAHLPAVKAFQARWEDALVAPIEALDFVMEDLGPDAWTPMMAEAV